MAVGQALRGRVLACNATVARQAARTSLARQAARSKLHITSPSIMAWGCHEDHVAHGRHPPSEVT